MKVLTCYYNQVVR